MIVFIISGSVSFLYLLRDSLPTRAIKSPTDKDKLKDIAVLVGAHLIAEDENVPYEELDVSVIGSAR